MYITHQTLEMCLEKQHHINKLKLFELPTSTRGSSTSMGRNVGVARPRAFEYFQGVVRFTDAEHKLFLFDIQMFTRIIK